MPSPPSQNTIVYLNIPLHLQTFFLLRIQKWIRIKTLSIIKIGLTFACPLLTRTSYSRPALRRERANRRPVSLSTAKSAPLCTLYSTVPLLPASASVASTYSSTEKHRLFNFACFIVSGFWWSSYNQLKTWKTFGTIKYMFIRFN